NRSRGRRWMTSAARIGSRRARRRDAAATRDALLAAGTEPFAERGYDGVPVWAVAQKAGVNKAMISYHFGGKRKLYRATLSAAFGDQAAGRRGVREAHPGPAHARARGRASQRDASQRETRRMSARRGT